MIKLELPKKPTKLTPQLVRTLTAKYRLDGSDVWNEKFIREAVIKFSNNKCCYTECKLDVESKYFEIDHFLPKVHFPKKVVSWGNLLPSCKKSNTTKGELNTSTTPIINPLVDNPKDHLQIRSYRFYHKTPLGRNTIDFTALNDRKHFVNKRYEIGTKVIEIIEDITEKIVSIEDDIINNKRAITRLINNYKSLLNEAGRKEEYSASTATTILTEPNNKFIVTFLNKNGFWDDELEELLKELEFCSLI